MSALREGGPLQSATSQRFCVGGGGLGDAGGSERKHHEGFSCYIIVGRVSVKIFLSPSSSSCLPFSLSLLIVHSGSLLLSVCSSSFVFYSVFVSLGQGAFVKAKA